MDNNVWYIDSKCSIHLCPQKDWFKGYKEIASRRIYMGDNTIMETINMGNVEVNMSMKDEIIDVIFKDMILFLR
jgi:hypothetical protein